MRRWSRIPTSVTPTCGSRATATTRCGERWNPYWPTRVAPGSSARLRWPLPIKISMRLRRAVDEHLGQYTLGELLGAGGMGEVYRARDNKLGRDVAIKFLPRALALDPDRLARFQREARTLASLNHPAIAAIYGIEEFDGVPALVLELVEGETLAERILRGSIPLDEALADRTPDCHGPRGSARKGDRSSRPETGECQDHAVCEQSRYSTSGSPRSLPVPMAAMT